MMSLQKALPWREGVKTATQGKPEDHDRCSLACGGEFSSLAQPGFFLSEGVSGSGVCSDIQTDPVCGSVSPWLMSSCFLYFLCFYMLPFFCLVV